MNDSPAPVSDEQVTSEPLAVLLFRGGPFYTLQQRSGLVEANGEGQPRSALFFVLIAWLPLVALAALQGLAIGPTPSQSILLDLAVNVRCLVSLPLLLLSERLADQRFAHTGRQFLRAGLIRTADLEAFSQGVQRVRRWRDSRVVEGVLLVVAVLSSISVTHHHLATDAASWRTVIGAPDTLSLAGWWMTAITQPLFQFVLLRWVWRLVIWTVFLARLARLNLAVVVTHPDGCGGLGFLAASPQAFMLFILALSALLSAAWGNAYLHDGVNPLSYRNAFIAYVVIIELCMLIPLLVFMPVLGRARRAGMVAYSAFSSRVANQFEQRWITTPTPAESEFLEQPDPSALADLSAVFGAAKSMKTLPLGRETLVSIAVAAVLPMLPLVTAVVPLSALLQQLAKALL